MGTNFTALVNHNFDVHHISTLPDLLNRIWPKVEPLLPILKGYPAPGIPPCNWKWSEKDRGFSVTRLLNNDTAGLNGYEFNGIVSKHVFRVCHGVRWSSFLTDPTVRGKLRQVCQHIVSVLGSNQIVYLPDGFLKPEGAIGLMYEGKAIEDMIDWLLENCGPATQSIDSYDLKDLANWWCEELDTWYYIENI